MSIKNLSETIKAMMAAGCTPEQIAAVLDVHSKADEEAQNKKREKWKNDKRRQRMSTNVHQDTSGVFETGVDKVDPLSLNGSPPAPIYKNNTPLSLNPISNNRPRPLEGFDLFWSAYPRREGKGRAEKAWTKAVRLASPEKIIEAVKATKWSDEKQFIPLPASWLNDRRWEDELPGMVHKISKEEFEEQERKRIAYLMDLAKKTDRSFQ